MQISTSAPGFIPHPNSLVECPVINQQSSLIESLRSAAETIAPDMSHTESLPAAEPALTHAPPPLPAPIVNLNSRTIMLNGIEIRVDPKEIPITPLAMKFSNDLNYLFREWHSSTLLKIADHGIPLKLWPEVYKLAGQAHWSSWQQTHKVLWSNFKVCLPNDTFICFGSSHGNPFQFIAEERNKFRSDEEFWEVWRCNITGKRMGQQAILDKLQERRGMIDKNDADDARIFFKGNLDHADALGAFLYMKKGKKVLMTKDAKIAEKWRQLLKNPDISARWAVMQAEREIGI